MAQVDQGWSGDKNDLQHPEADVRDGEGFVVAHIFATRLLNLLSSSPQHQYPEDKQHRQPNLADNRGVLLRVLQQPPQKAPVTHRSRFLTYNKSNIYIRSTFHSPNKHTSTF
uniref:Uncharacterized protein n=1 Tax=Anas platyrhynchos TaxID=8839 RepID=A0A8B9SUW6_ANAPL